MRLRKYSSKWLDAEQIFKEDNLSGETPTGVSVCVCRLRLQLERIAVDAEHGVAMA